MVLQGGLGNNPKNHYIPNFQIARRTIRYLPLPDFAPSLGGGRMSDSPCLDSMAMGPKNWVR